MEFLLILSFLVIIGFVIYTNKKRKPIVVDENLFAQNDVRIDFSADTIVKHLFFLLLLFIVASCKKDGDVTPINADKITGTYTVYSVIYGSSTISLPFTSNGLTTSASIVVTKKTDLSVGVVIVQRANSSVSARTDLGTLDIKGSDLYERTDKVGNADGTNFTIDATDNGVRAAFFSRR